MREVTHINVQVVWRVVAHVLVQHLDTPHEKHKPDSDDTAHCQVGTIVCASAKRCRNVNLGTRWFIDGKERKGRTQFPLEPFPPVRKMAGLGTIATKAF
jgi:hypothetical protein